MKIKETLFYAFGVYILLAAIFGLLAYLELRTIANRLNFLEAGDDISITMLEVRRHEKNFLLYKDRTELPEIRKHLGVLRESIGKMKREIAKEIGARHYAALEATINEYEGWVDEVARNREAQEDLISSIRSAGRKAETSLSGEELKSFLVLRRQEKNIMLFRDRETYDAFSAEQEQLGPKAGHIAGQYLSFVKGLFKLYAEEDRLVENMRSGAREVQSYTVELSREERREISSTLRSAAILIFFSLVVTVLAGTWVNVKLSRNIANPLLELEGLATRAASGDLSQRIEVKGEDEIASLERAFNYMEERLQEALSSLEATIVQLKEKQAQLVEAEKHASVGILAAGVAHEINNPLTAVLTFSNLLLEQMPKEDPRYERMRMVARETERARHIVRQLMGLAKETPLALAKKNVNQPIRDIVESLLAQGELDDVDFHLNLSPDLPLVMADCGQIGQVVLNLILNALHSITPPGAIEVLTRTDGRYVDIEVSDTGCGIPAEHLGRVFDSFFTTKSKGTGLGLAVSYRIVKRHGGDIEVRSEEGKGSTFTVRLPLNG